jgi:hypothetical protein
LRGGSSRTAISKSSRVFSGDNGAEIAKATFTGADVPTVRARILDELNRRAANEQDAALSAAVVGKLLAQV